MSKDGGVRGVTHTNHSHVFHMNTVTESSQERDKRKEGAHMFSTCTQSDRVLTGEERQKTKEGEEILPQYKEKVDTQININQLEICLPNDDDVFDIDVQQKQTLEAEIFPVNSQKSCCLLI